MAQSDMPGLIFTTLHKEIINLTIKPGQAVNEADICSRFGASRTPVRTAFQRLSDAGLLQIIPYKGAFATLLDFDYITQMIFLRQAVEAKVLTEIIEQADPFVAERIRYSIRCQSLLLSSKFTADEFYEVDSAMHSIWFEHTKREHVWQTIQQFEVHYTRFRMLDIVEVQNFREIVDEHVELLQCIEQHDIAGMERLLDTHLMGGIKRLGDRIHNEFAGYFLNPANQKRASGARRS